jgi:hypothetical protein
VKEWWKRSWDAGRMGEMNALMILLGAGIPVALALCFFVATFVYYSYLK